MNPARQEFTLYGRNLLGGTDSGMEVEGKLQKQEVRPAAGDPKARTSLAGTAPVGRQAGLDGEYRLPSPKGSPIRSEFSLPLQCWRSSR